MLAAAPGPLTLARQEGWKPSTFRPPPALIVSKPPTVKKGLTATAQPWYPKEESSSSSNSNSSSSKGIAPTPGSRSVMEATFAPRDHPAVRVQAAFSSTASATAGVAGRLAVAPPPALGLSPPLQPSYLSSLAAPLSDDQLPLSENCSTLLSPLCSPVNTALNYFTEEATQERVYPLDMFLSVRKDASHTPHGVLRWAVRHYRRTPALKVPHHLQLNVNDPIADEDATRGALGTGLKSKLRARPARQIHHKVLSVLSRVTPQRYNELAEELIELPLRQTDDVELKEVVRVFFDKAVQEHTYSGLYARLVKEICTVKEGDMELARELWDKLLCNRMQRELISKCEEEFKRPIQLKADDLVDRTTGRTLGGEEVSMKRDRLKQRLVGNIKFVGELYKMELVTETVIEHILLLLVGDYCSSNPTEKEDYVFEVFTTLMRCVALKLGQSRPEVVAHLMCIAQVIKTTSPHNRVRFLMMDLEDLEKAKWVKKDAFTEQLDAIDSCNGWKEPGEQGLVNGLILGSTGSIASMSLFSLTSPVTQSPTSAQLTAAGFASPNAADVCSPTNGSNYSNGTFGGAHFRQHKDGLGFANHRGSMENLVSPSGICSSNNAVTRDTTNNNNNNSTEGLGNFRGATVLMGSFREGSPACDSNDNGGNGNMAVNCNQGGNGVAGNAPAGQRFPQVSGGRNRFQNSNCGYIYPSIQGKGDVLPSKQVPENVNNSNGNSNGVVSVVRAAQSSPLHHQQLQQQPHLSQYNGGTGGYAVASSPGLKQSRGSPPYGNGNGQRVHYTQERPQSNNMKQQQYTPPALSPSLELSQGLLHGSSYWDSPANHGPRTKGCHLSTESHSPAPSPSFPIPARLKTPVGFGEVNCIQPGAAGGAPAAGIVNLQEVTKKLINQFMQPGEEGIVLRSLSEMSMKNRIMSLSWWLRIVTTSTSLFAERASVSRLFAECFSEDTGILPHEIAAMVLNCVAFDIRKEEFKGCPRVFDNICLMVAGAYTPALRDHPCIDIVRGIFHCGVFNSTLLELIRSRSTDQMVTVIKSVCGVMPQVLESIEDPPEESQVLRLAILNRFRMLPYLLRVSSVTESTLPGTPTLRCRTPTSPDHQSNSLNDSMTSTCQYDPLGQCMRLPKLTTEPEMVLFCSLLRDKASGAWREIAEKTATEDPESGGKGTVNRLVRVMKVIGTLLSCTSVSIGSENLLSYADVDNVLTTIMSKRPCSLLGAAATVELMMHYIQSLGHTRESPRRSARLKPLRQVFSRWCSSRIIDGREALNLLASIDSSEHTLFSVYHTHMTDITWGDTLATLAGDR